MGQILSNLWRWICPKPKKELPKSSNNHNANYQTFPQDENQLQSHYININDHYVHSISGSSLNETIQKHVNNLDDPLTSHIVVDLRDGYEENAKKMKRKKTFIGQNDQVIPEVVLEKSVTTTINHVPKLSNKVEKIGPYTSAQRILLVGEGDFSFSACLAVAFGTSAANITATSLNSKKFLNKNYGKFTTNKTALEARGSTILHGVDATMMLRHPILGNMVFDRIIFNFPHAGKFGKTDIELIMHKKLIRGFLKNAKKMIDDGGEIHITSKSNGFFLDWDIPKIGSDHGLKLIQEVKFKRSKYPGYNTKYGFGGDRDFDCDPSKTYKFGLTNLKK